ncbi:hypothetical protein OG920_44410 [Streptomyces europaeiscabiei]|uniref:hypothetical protein n=1 Tax=Streptomyces TaxID=1883 RepID=UPI00117EC0C6|nr:MULTISPECIES: hypothetical protein [Streptomyces]MDX3587433.1 hypothetical protein [Streptomyces europaeiscabiei]MDX3616142.1 hypothetical protein [Streptomyces europaeiscabiei]MDX3636802.1 hypothetical protein [Streptomyces europaeiscabiei]MDX3655027.1 hypothetical protein [Streptomyces europaeiscabiei]WUD37894.1 hypothetical protein OG858_45140 [Streptomyces europaeiscabiei]
MNGFEGKGWAPVTGSGRQLLRERLIEAIDAIRSQSVVAERAAQAFDVVGGIRDRVGARGGCRAVIAAGWDGPDPSGPGLGGRTVPEACDQA